jgi:hypothetical protein
MIKDADKKKVVDTIENLKKLDDRQISYLIGIADAFKLMEEKDLIA